LFIAKLLQPGDSKGLILCVLPYTLKGGGTPCLNYLAQNTNLWSMVWIQLIW